MTREQRERVGTWIRWALALALIPTVAAIDGRYVKQTAYELNQVRDSAWRADVIRKLDYNACRWDKPSKECVR